MVGRDRWARRKVPNGKILAEGPAVRPYLHNSIPQERVFPC